GVLVANAANALGMQVYGYDPYLSVDAAWNLSRSIKHSTNIKEIFENCDYITLHIPATPDTKGMINAESIELMPDGVRILNFARGELVDSADLLAALGSGKVAAYATDFPSDDLLGANGVLAIPHLGASTPESEENCAQMAVIELMGFLQDGNIKNSVNLPTVELPRSAGTRLTLIHKNIPNMINQITSTFTAENVNIENMVNKSKGTIAYTVIDADGDIPEHAIECIKVIDGMVKVRVIK
ncbi:MAG: 3-phosphoglycerate dehydrogenase, partial [Clostridiales bacterium]|nr:3-phosphoglycerate dehydrogenase [Clostridiales bacterium]